MTQTTLTDLLAILSTHADIPWQASEAMRNYFNRDEAVVNDAIETLGQLGFLNIGKPIFSSGGSYPQYRFRINKFLVLQACVA